MAHKRRSPGLRPRGDGTRGPRHSSTYTPAGRVSDSVPAQPDSSYAVCGLFASAGMQSAPHIGCFLLLILSTVATSAVTPAKRMLRRPLKTTVAVFLCIFIVFLLSGFNLEGNMDMDAEKQTQPPADDDQWLLAVEAEARAIEQLPYVKAVAFSYGETANLCKVFASVWCCWENSRRTFKQVAVSCDLDTKPTYLEALHALHEKVVEKHGAADHQHDPRASARRAELHAAGSSAQPAVDGNAFDRMKAAASRMHVAQQRAAADAAALEHAVAAELAAVQLREAAEARAKASKAAASELQKNAPPPQKRQKAATATDAAQQDVEGTAEQADPEAWESYSISMFRSLFRKFARTSSVQVDPNNTDLSLPAQGDDHGKRGWRNHAQHGMWRTRRRRMQGRRQGASTRSTLRSCAGSTCRCSRYCQWEACRSTWCSLGGAACAPPLPPPPLRRRRASAASRGASPSSALTRRSSCGRSRPPTSA